LSAAEAQGVIIMKREEHEELARRSTFVTILLSSVVVVLALFALASYLKYRHIYQDYTQLLQEHQHHSHANGDGDEDGGEQELEDEGPDQRLRTSVPAAAWAFDQQSPQGVTEISNPLEKNSGGGEQESPPTLPETVEIEMMGLSRDDGPLEG
jgi:hypothetical protein